MRAEWIVLENGIILGTPVWSQLLADEALCNGCSHVGLGEWKSMLMNRCIISILVIVATLFMTLLSNKKSSSGKRLTGIPRTGHLIHLIIKILCWGHLLVRSHITHKYRHVFCFFRSIQKVLSAYLFPRYPHPKISNHAPYKFLTIGHSSWIGIDSYLWPFLLRKMNNQMHCPKFCLLEGFLFTTVLQRCPRERWLCSSCPVLNDACISCKTICKPCLSFLFLSQLTIRTPSPQ